MIARLTGRTPAEVLARTKDQPVRQSAARSEGRFPLLRYFLGTSLIVIAAVTVAVAVMFVRRAERDFAVRASERGAAEAAQLVQQFYYSIWAPAVANDPEARLTDIIDPMALGKLAAATFGLNIIAMNLLDIDETRLWTSSPAALGRYDLDVFLYDTAMTQGVYASELQRDDAGPRDADGQRNRALVRVYYPLRDAPLDMGREGRIVGVMEIVKDVTADLARTRRETLEIAILGSVGSAATLFVLLLIVVWKADRSIARGQERLLLQQSRLDDARAKHIQSAKLAAVGELAAGFTHELNNPLTSIWGLSQLLVARDIEPSIKSEIAMIQSESERAVRIVQSLLSFARSGADEKSLISVNDVIESILELRSYELRANSFTVQVELAPGLPMIMADTDKIRQLALNLIMNAEQAMTNSKVGDRLLVRTKQVDDTILFTVGDNGPGIPDENLEKIFDPFFTTKDVGEGTGLGLSVCYGIVRDHGGVLRVEKEIPRGVRFIVELPVTSQDG